ncbi:MAG: hypothetical protein AB8E82_15930 [Aureispira sp.]
MKLLQVKEDIEFSAEILEIEERDFAIIKKSGQFQFDWSREQGCHVFKIVKQGDEEILGLLSVINYPQELRIHINLIESADDNKGKGKKVDRIAGCLLAFAAKLAFENSYLGFVSLVPKTELIELYVKKYGFIAYGNQLAIEKQASINLINKYL